MLCRRSVNTRGAPGAILKSIGPIQWKSVVARRADEVRPEVALQCRRRKRKTGAALPDGALPFSRISALRIADQALRPRRCDELTDHLVDVIAPSVSAMLLKAAPTAIGSAMFPKKEGRRGLCRQDPDVRATHIRGQNVRATAGRADRPAHGLIFEIFVPSIETPAINPALASTKPTTGA